MYRICHPKYSLHAPAIYDNRSLAISLPEIARRNGGGQVPLSSTRCDSSRRWEFIGSYHSGAILALYQHGLVPDRQEVRPKLVPVQTMPQSGIVSLRMLYAFYAESMYRSDNSCVETHCYTPSQSGNARSGGFPNGIRLGALPRSLCIDPK